MGEPLQLNEGVKWVSVSAVDNNTKMVFVSADIVVTNNQENNSSLAFVLRLNKFITSDLPLAKIKIKIKTKTKIKIRTKTKIKIKTNNSVNLVGE
jgi:hypothetical protein